MDYAREFINVNGLRAAYAVCGAGSLPVLALHGWGGSIDSFWPVAQQLTRQPGASYTVYILDLPGFGETEPPPEPWGVPEYAAFVLGALDTLYLERVHLLGHSFGGRISLVLGAEHPERIGKIVLADSAGVPNPPNLARDAAVRAAKSLFQLPGLKQLYEPARRRAYARLGAMDYLEAGALRESFVKVIEQDLLPYAARMPQSTLLIWGDRDEDTPLWQGRKLEAAIPDAGLIIFPGAGHFSYLERLSEYVHIVHHFLGEPAGEVA